MKKNFRKILIASMTSALSITLFAGCATSGETVAGTVSAASGETVQQLSAVYSEEDKIAGTLLLSVNPEIELEYDYNGLVQQLNAVNTDGKDLLAGYTGYENRECGDVASELVEKIYNSGYFTETIGGQQKNIVLRLEKDSDYPDDDFLEEIARKVRSTVEECGIASQAMTLDRNDIGENGYINTQAAQNLVLAQLHFDDASFTEREYELDDGVYELEFTRDGVEYEYEVDAVTGKVLEADYEHNDDWSHYSDDWYDDDHDDQYDDDADDRYDDDYDDQYDDDADDWYDDDHDDQYDDDADDWYDDDHDDQYDDDTDDWYDDDRYDDMDD